MTNGLNPDEFPELNLGGGDAAQDDNLVLDLGGVSEDLPKFEVMPAGTYPAIIENVEYVARSKRSGNPMLTWTFKVTDPNYDGRLLFYHTVLNKDAGLARLKRLLIRVLPELSLKFHPVRFCEEGQALGRPCQLKVRVTTRKNDEGRSEPTNSVTDVLALEESGSFLDGELE